MSATGDNHWTSHTHVHLVTTDIDTRASHHTFEVVLREEHVEASGVSHRVIGNRKVDSAP